MATLPKKPYKGVTPHIATLTEKIKLLRRNNTNDKITLMYFMLPGFSIMNMKEAKLYHVKCSHH